MFIPVVRNAGTGT